MAEQRYRFGGPIPESVLALQKRRRYRDSSLYAGVKKIRREKFWANPPAGWVTERDGMGSAMGIKRAQSDFSALEKEQARAALAPFERGSAPAGYPAVPNAGPSGPASGADIPR